MVGPYEISHQIHEKIKNVSIFFIKKHIKKTNKKYNEKKDSNKKGKRIEQKKGNKILSHSHLNNYSLSVHVKLSI